MKAAKPFAMQCPMPVKGDAFVRLAHGGGGRLMHELLENVILPAFQSPLAVARHDGAVWRHRGVRWAFSTDSYVVRPLFFPGGDIGKLAVHGTVNDLAMCGAKPLYLSAGFILEEGLPMQTLKDIVVSMRDAAKASGVEFVTGDTKVVDKGKGDGVYINTAGVGLVDHSLIIAPAMVKPGDQVLVNGDIGRHGMAIMAQREGLAFESPIESDTMPLNGIVSNLIDAGIAVHCLRDLTRGGLATSLIEIAETSGREIHADESQIPVSDAVQGACEVLGLDPLYVANEGRFIAFVSPDDAEHALACMRAHPAGKGTRVIGSVGEAHSGMVVLKSKLGTSRVLDMQSGEQLPRIC